ncbi:MAG TPA: hypothetical protein VF101_09575 [Gaiellaceae bacterium]
MVKSGHVKVEVRADDVVKPPAELEVPAKPKGDTPAGWDFDR